MLKAYKDKETEFNWEARDKSITRLRGILRGNATEAPYLEVLVQCMRQMVDGIIKAVSLLVSLFFLSCSYMLGRKLTYTTRCKRTFFGERYWCVYG